MSLCHKDILRISTCNGEHIAVEQYEHTTNAEFFEQWFSERLLKEVPMCHFKKGEIGVLDLPPLIKVIYEAVLRTT